MAAVAAQLRATPNNAIAQLHRGAFGAVEFLRCDGANALPARSEIAAYQHFSLPLSGSFVWHAENEAVFADPTALLCTQKDEPYLITHPHGGDQTLVFFPRPHVLAEMSEQAEKAGLGGRRRTFVASSRAQLLAYTLCLNPLTARDSLAADECLLQFFESIALSGKTVRTTRDDALVRRALEYIHDMPEPLLTLKGIATALDVRSAYLTHAFAQRTGMPLYRYIMKLKLARALHKVALDADDLTHIALDLGFSSHSHFSAAFKAHYGLTPSQLRDRVGRRRGRLRRQVPARGEEGDARKIVWRPLCAARGGVQAQDQD